MDLADRAPDNGRTDKAAHVLEFFVEGPGSLGVAVPAQKHGGGGKGTTDIADGVTRVTEAEQIVLPLRVLLGQVNELEGHVYLLWQLKTTTG